MPKIDDLPQRHRVYGPELLELTGYHVALADRLGAYRKFPKSKRVGAGSWAWDRREIVRWLRDTPPADRPKGIIP